MQMIVNLFQSKIIYANGRCYINVYFIHNSYNKYLHNFYLYKFSLTYLQYESLKILK